MIQAIKEAKPGATVWDRGDRSSVRGLHAKVLSGGTASFYFYYRTKGGKQRRPKLGTFGEITVAEARTRARELAKRVAVGEDPRGDWANKKAELTVGDIFQRCLDDHWTEARVSAHWLKQIRQNWENHLKKPFGGMKATDLQPKDIKAWLRGFESSPYAGNRSLEALSKAYRFAQEEGLVPLGVNPCSFVKALPERKRGRFATPEEIRAVGARLDAWADRRPAMVAFCYLLMFSGTRPSVITRARWNQLEEFDIRGEQWGRLRVHGKTSGVTGEEDIVILPPQAMRVIQKLDRATSTITGVLQPQKFWEIIRKEAGCEDLWIRDFRRTFATVGLSAGQTLGTIGELLNHRSQQTTMIYAKLMEHARIGAAGSIAASIEGMLALPAPESTA